jgi:hypothetical protein
MEPEDQRPPPTHTAFAVHRSQDYPPEWVRLGTLTHLKNGHITGRFTGTPTAAWGWEWLAVPVGENPPPLSQERPPKRPAQPSRPAAVTAPRPSQPLPGEDEDEAQSLFSGGDETS